MDPISELKNEHEAVLVTLNVLQRIAAAIHDTDRIDQPEDVEQLLDFFRVFVDTCHHGKEEDYLFPVLEQLGVSRNGGPIGVMLREHEQGRGEVREMRKALKAYRGGDPSAAAEFASHAAAYIGLLRRHIDKENNVLFPIADSRLSTVRQISLEEDFERLEQERIGAGRHEAFHRMIEELGKRYLT
jgi:hemerythrin-like domain-containing protein